MVVSEIELAGATSNKLGHPSDSCMKCSGNNDPGYNTNANDNDDDDDHDNITMMKMLIIDQPQRKERKSHHKQRRKQEQKILNFLSSIIRIGYFTPYSY